MKEEEEQSAFPALHLDGHRGMTLRDYFATKVMQGTLSTSNMKYPNSKQDIEILAEISYTIADAMLKQREL
jgi:hypothetical protein